MHDESPHPLLAQVPLTVSPFLSLPTATTLSYSYKQLPSTLPPSSTDPIPASTDPSSNATSKPAYVHSSSGHSAHPDEIIESCRRLHTHLQELQEKASEALKQWQDSIRERDLAEKRRVAPGWLDTEDRGVLVPEKHHVHGTTAAAASPHPKAEQSSLIDSVTPGEQRDRDREGEEIDRAFGGMGLS